MQANKKYSKEIITFLKSHPFISVNAIERALDLPFTTLSKAMTGQRDISEKHLWNIILALSSYGLTIKGYSCKVTESGNLKLWKKWRDGGKTEHVFRGNGADQIYKISYDLEEYRHTATSLADLDNLYTEDKNPYKSLETV
ncbi:hypothetical protein [Emticicia sp. BO119]|uniref:hypothetical protein n=1 Tax=Emticicia sp. BO119 TaxID=2757768 RepID=UPI0015F0AC33|nr:hypothetical protein [Emticicia sp. BO119]MBA4852082.1 hypothetical protein [Emticicia sp. BO119]